MIEQERFVEKVTAISNRISKDKEILWLIKEIENEAKEASAPYETEEIQRPVFIPVMLKVLLFTFIPALIAGKIIDALIPSISTWTMFLAYLMIFGSSAVLIYARKVGVFSEKLKLKEDVERKGAEARTEIYNKYGLSCGEFEVLREIVWENISKNIKSTYEEIPAFVQAYMDLYKDYEWFEEDCWLEKYKYAMEQYYNCVMDYDKWKEIMIARSKKVWDKMNDVEVGSMQENREKSRLKREIESQGSKLRDEIGMEARKQMIENIREDLKI
jgi:hypothetical protein